ncbi:MAG TPA: hypothetical protein VNJ03_05750, partial [Vicinamibacterales bacterium]|nr:hypothetical protein [Vicinamibacterales bacterium]
MREMLVPTGTHGRVLVRDAPAPRGLLVGFHGYMEDAQIQMDRLAGIPGADEWTLVSVQALNRFYRGRSEDVVAGWMTRQDREAAIQDNCDYVNRAVEVVAPGAARIVYTGFSQGVAMAFRAAVQHEPRFNTVQHGSPRATVQHGSTLLKTVAIIAVGGDVPPELLEDPAATFPPVLLARGARDEWYTAAKLDADMAALTARGVRAESLVYDGGHEWTPEVS